MLVYPFYGQTSTLTVWACRKQNLTLGRKGGGGGCLDSAPSANKVFLRFFPEDQTSAPDDFSS